MQPRDNVIQFAGPLGWRGFVFGLLLVAFGGLLLLIGGFGLAFRDPTASRVLNVVVGPIAILGGSLLLAGLPGGRWIGTLAFVLMSANCAAYMLPKHGFTGFTVVSSLGPTLAALSLARSHKPRPRPL
jgi:hypothetical protein